MAPRIYTATPASGPVLTLADLRELVEDTTGLPADALVRAQPNMQRGDMMNPNGFQLRGLAIEFERGPRPSGQVGP